MARKLAIFLAASSILSVGLCNGSSRRTLMSRDACPSDQDPKPKVVKVIGPILGPTNTTMDHSKFNTPDPSVRKIGDFWYVLTTGTDLPYCYSRDLFSYNWNCTGPKGQLTALPNGGAWTGQGGGKQAFIGSPDISKFNSSSGQESVVVYYTAYKRNEKIKCLGMATLVPTPGDPALKFHAEDSPIFCDDDDSDQDSAIATTVAQAEGADNRYLITKHPAACGTTGDCAAKLQALNISRDSGIPPMGQNPVTLTYSKKSGPGEESPAAVHVCNKWVLFHTEGVQYQDYHVTYAVSPGPTLIPQGSANYTDYHCLTNPILGDGDSYPTDPSGKIQVYAPGGMDFIYAYNNTDFIFAARPKPGGSDTPDNLRQLYYGVVEYGFGRPATCGEGPPR